MTWWTWLSVGFVLGMTWTAIVMFAAILTAGLESNERRRGEIRFDTPESRRSLLASNSNGPTSPPVDPSNRRA